MTKKYDYIVSVEIDFEKLIKDHPLTSKNSLKDCQLAVSSYITLLDDCEYYAINNRDEIAKDLYDYLQSKNEEK